MKADILVVARAALRHERGKFSNAMDYECAIAEVIEEISPQIMESCAGRISAHVDPECPLCGGSGRVEDVASDVEQWIGVVVGAGAGGLLAFGDTFLLPHMDGNIEWTRNPHGALGVDDWLREVWFASPDCDTAIPLLKGCPLVFLHEDAVDMVAGNYFNSVGGGRA